MPPSVDEDAAMVQGLSRSTIAGRCKRDMALDAPVRPQGIGGRGYERTKRAGNCTAGAADKGAGGAIGLLSSSRSFAKAPR